MAIPFFYAFGTGAPVQSLYPSKNVLGGKGANLIEMANLGLPVPPGVVISTDECRLYLSMDQTQRDALALQLADAVIEHMVTKVQPVLGNFPLLSVRSGARVSMPGMMDTLLNIGLTKDNANEWRTRLGKSCYQDCLTRLGDMYVKTVGAAVPATLREQLAGAIGAVFRSWNSERAVEYRRLHGYPDDWYTAVTVQAMVFGNLNTESCSGVLFTREPATGEDVVTGEFLPKAQGEDVVAGVRTPRPLHLMEGWNAAILDELLTISGRLEQHYRDMQDIEFTVQDGKLWILQTRNAKRTAAAAFKIAYDMALEGLIEKSSAVKRVTGAQYQALLRPTLVSGFDVPPALVGLPASPGLVSGPAVFDPDSGATGGILIRNETTPEDFPAMVRSAAVLTSTGGATSHAAVVARGINKPAVVGATALSVARHGGQITSSAGVVPVKPGDLITLDGATGNVWVNTIVPVIGGAPTPEARAVVGWAATSSGRMVLRTVGNPENLPEAGVYYLSVANLRKVTEFRALFQELAKRPDLRGVIGFERSLPKLDADDLEYLTLLGTVTARVEQDSAALISLLKAVAKTHPKKLKTRWRIHLPGSASPPQIELVTDHEWSLVRTVHTLADLLAADGPVQFSEDFRARMAQESVELGTVLDLLVKTGRPVTEFNGAVEEKDFVNEVLGL